MRANSAGAVRDFYERFPYPPPLDSLDTYRRRWDRRGAAPISISFWPARPYRGSISSRS